MTDHPNRSADSVAPPADLAARIELYLDDKPSDGGHSDAAGSNCWELLYEAMEELRAPAQPARRGSMAAQFTYDPEGEAYYFAPLGAQPGPYYTQRHVDAILDIAFDGTLAGVELIDRVPPPPCLASQPSPAATVEINQFETTKAGVIDWKMEAERANRLLSAHSRSSAVSVVAWEHKTSHPSLGEDGPLLTFYEGNPWGYRAADILAASTHTAHPLVYADLNEPQTAAQTIDTAPKDGTHILAWRRPIGIRVTDNTHPPTVVHWFDDPDEPGFYTSVNELAPEHPFNPTHWMPLPSFALTRPQHE
jgi:hypothetical protein